MEVPLGETSRREAPAEAPETEFWDAPWTFDDDWLPHSESRSETAHRPTADATCPPSVFSLL